MLRNINFINIKPGADEERMLYLLNHEYAEYAKTFGCIERKTWKLLDAYHHELGERGEPAEAATYLNESLWPSQKEADAFGQSERPEEVKAWVQELGDGVEFVLTVRYVDDEG